MRKRSINREKWRIRTSINNKLAEKLGGLGGYGQEEQKQRRLSGMRRAALLLNQF